MFWKMDIGAAFVWGRGWLTSHRMEEVERLCGRVLLLSEGGIILQGTPEELARQSEGKGLRDLVLGLQEDSGE